jgi:hypothetical protein
MLTTYRISRPSLYVFIRFMFLKNVMICKQAQFLIAVFLTKQQCEREYIGFSVEYQIVLLTRLCAMGAGKCSTCL